jgi:hypothetical protein
MIERTTDCLSDYALEKALVGDAWPSPLSQAEQAHLKRCPSCAGRLDTAREAEVGLIHRVPPAHFSALLPEWRKVHSSPGLRFRWPALVTAGLGLLAMLGLALLVMLPDSTGLQPLPHSTEEVGYIGVRGGTSLAVHVKRGEHRFRLEPGRSLHPGDTLRVVPASSGHQWLLVLLRDAGGAVQVLYPWSGFASGPMPEAGEPAPGAFELDEVPGAEVVLALATGEPVLAARVTAWLSNPEWSAADPAPVAGDLAMVRYMKVVP